MKSEIKIEVTLDEQKRPKELAWTADSKDNGKETRDTKAMLLSFFDRETLETFKIDLWTTDMKVAEMDRFMFHTLRALTETYYKATNNDTLANQMHGFVEHFGKATKIIQEES